jgi:ferredoxin
MSINVDKDMCIGCGACVSLCPNTFALNAEGKAEPISQEDAECAQKAAEGCPVQAIEVR